MVFSMGSIGTCDFGDVWSKFLLIFFLNRVSFRFFLNYIKFDDNYLDDGRNSSVGM